MPYVEEIKVLGARGVFFFEGHDRYTRVTGVNEWKVSTEFRVYSEPRALECWSAQKMD
jgi:hypothetical protein